MEDDLNINSQPAAPEDSPEIPAVLTDQMEDEEEEISPRHKSLSKKWLIIGGVLLVFLAAAAFLGARLLKPPSTANGEGNGSGLVFKGGPGGGKSVRLNMLPAPELPKDKSAKSGLFVRREDQSIFIGTGNVRMAVRKSSSANAPSDVSSHYDGPVVEVVVTHETKIYQDITEMTPPDSSKGEVTLQQVVKPGSLDDLGANMLVQVWGDKQGDRIVASTIVYR